MRLSSVPIKGFAKAYINGVDKYVEVFNDANITNWKNKNLVELKTQEEKDKEKELQQIIMTLIASYGVYKFVKDILLVGKANDIEKIIKTAKKEIKHPLKADIIKDLAHSLDAQGEQIVNSYIDRNLFELQNLDSIFSLVIARKIIANNKLNRQSVAKALWYTTGKNIPEGLSQTTSMLGRRVVESYIWKVNDPIDRACLVAKDEIRKSGKKFSNGLYSPPAHRACMCHLEPVSISKEFIKSFVSNYD